MIGMTTIVNRHRRWRRRRDMIATLNQISDRDLWDIGAKRADLPRIAGDLLAKAAR